MPTLTHSGLRHYFRLEGTPDRQPLVLVHPIGADHGIWDSVMPTLLEGFQVLRYDIRGHGGTETPPQRVTLEELSSDLLHLTHAMGWERFHACGLSIGGMAALHAATRAPSRVTALAVCSAVARMAEPPGGGWDARAATALREGMAPLAPPMIERMFTPDFRQAHPQTVETVRSTFLHTDPKGYAACLAVLRDADLRPFLAHVETPTLVMSGEQDMALSPAALSELVQGISGARHASFAGSGHFPPLEHPQEFAHTVAEFLRRHAANAS